MFSGGFRRGLSRLKHGLMLSMLMLCAALWTGPAAPTQTVPTGTTREFCGYANLAYVWGTLELRKCKRLHGLPARPAA